MGIGRPMGEQDPADFVLKAFSKDERGEIDSFTNRGAQAISSLILNGIDKAQTAFNS
jgi:PTH1 family peptidyl-tRNA hydrolase